MGRGSKARKERDHLTPPSAETYAVETLGLLFNKDIGFDAVITCRGEEFQIHKSLAAVRSAFMRVAFFSKFTVSTNPSLPSSFSRVLQLVWNVTRHYFIFPLPKHWQTNWGDFSHIPISTRLTGDLGHCLHDVGSDRWQALGRRVRSRGGQADGALPV